MLLMLRAGCVLGLALLAGRAASAQDVAYLVPSRQTAPAAAPNEVHLERIAGGAATRVAWPEARAGWMFISAQGNMENRHDVKPDQPGGSSVSVSTPDSGVAVAGLDLRPEVVTISAEAFAAFRAENMPTPAAGAAVQPKREGPGGQVRVRRYESMNTIIRAVDPVLEAAQSPIATAKTGQQASIRPVMDPTGLRAGSDVPFRVYTHGRAVGGGRLTATSLATGVTRAVAADSSGIVHIPIDATGIWRLQFHHATPSPDADADWNLYSATLTFEVTRPAKEGE